MAENGNNPKKLWKLIKNLTKDGTNKHSLINLLIDKEGNQYSEDQQMADLINSLYVNQPRDLLDSQYMYHDKVECIIALKQRCNFC